MDKNNSFSISIGTVMEVENTSSEDSYDGLRIRAALWQDGINKDTKDNSKISEIPWAFPLLPKVFQSIPKEGEAVFIFMKDDGDKQSQRYFIGPIISQPQYNTYCGEENASTLLQGSKNNPIGKISNSDYTRGSFPKSSDVAVVGRGKEDIILRYDEAAGASEVDLRVGIRGEATNSSDPNMIGNIIFNDSDPAYIQLKYKKSLSSYPPANSVINIVADKINLISNMDNNVADKIHDKDDLIADKNVKNVMEELQSVPLGNSLYDLLMIMRGCILNHVHPWAGMKQCGDNDGYINKLIEYDFSKILSKHVRIS